MKRVTTLIALFLFFSLFTLVFAQPKKAWADSACSSVSSSISPSEIQPGSTTNVSFTLPSSITGGNCSSTNNNISISFCNTSDNSCGSNHASDYVVPTKDLTFSNTDTGCNVSFIKNEPNAGTYQYYVNIVALPNPIVCGNSQLLKVSQIAPTSDCYSYSDSSCDHGTHGNTYKLCFNSPSDAGVQAQDCECVAELADHQNFCFFKSQDSYSKIKNGGGSSTTTTPAYFSLCNQAGSAEDKLACEKCYGANSADMTGTTGDKGQPNSLWTAFGCVPTNLSGIVTSIVQIGLGLSGGIVVLAILAGSFMLATSSGNPKQVEEAQQMISAAIIGLLFVIFSAIILHFIGVTLLHIPGFGV
ncbi:hypothetical protein C5B42_01895 [Candidatus Cerribacteria bacterium 'Amazon FNV 2010 28 9']|uniref:Uncharacterized protein n=1 Tax=Candidatus Cerribacteria bacterium 'Amazon FNV 2010 28 9' TaxID=2081795 RepID=A0A317JPJ6_9BACT|nr:MAG: hypothetical protein C5B42_01895 [Candidatus Cerribacteria bacterium 'Amazon FNV 2010 28 9']